jgi:thymidine kinase
MKTAGKLIVNVGGMFSGKSTELQRQGKRYALAGKKVAYYKPKLDNRYADEAIVTHDGKTVPAIPIADGLEILATTADVVLIDEVQFFDGSLIMAIEELLYAGIDVICSGLDMDRNGMPFGITPYLMAIADEVQKFRAVCADCGDEAWVSFGNFASDKQVELGSQEKYKPLCRSCFYEKRSVPIDR